MGRKDISAQINFLRDRRIFAVGQVSGKSIALKLDNKFHKEFIIKKYFMKGRSKMNKTELIEAMAKNAGLTKKDTESALNAFIDTVETALVKGDKIQLVGFGTFEVGKRAARTGKNPATGETIKIKASKAPKFKAGKALKDKVNKVKK